MTTEFDNQQNREASELWSTSIEFTQGVPVDNTIDPNGMYPNRNYFFGSSVNTAARGSSVYNLANVGSYTNVDLNLPPVGPSIYPYNQVNETEYGHVISIDDTPGGQRILIKHASGSGIDIRADGSVIISSQRNRVELVQGDNSLIVEGDANVVYKGNLSLEVSGDYDLNVGGDYNVNVRGQNTKTVQGSSRVRVERNETSTILGTSAKTIGENHNTTVVGNTHTILNGTYDLLSDNDINISLSGTIHTSSQKTISFAAENIESVSNTVGIIAPNGTIGGENTEHFGKTFAGPPDGDGTGTSFVGSLVGIAAEAITSRYAKYAEESWINNGVSRYAITATNLSNVPLPFTGSIGSPPDYKMILVDDYTENRPDFRMPTQSLVSGILNTTNKGIFDVEVFGEDIRKRITLEDEFGEAFSTEPTLEEFRHEMRIDAFASGDGPKAATARGVIGDYTASIPDTATRSTDANATTRYGETILGNPSETVNKAFKARKE